MDDNELSDFEPIVDEMEWDQPNPTKERKQLVETSSESSEGSDGDEDSVQITKDSKRSNKPAQKAPPKKNPPKPPRIRQHIPTARKRYFFLPDFYSHTTRLDYHQFQRCHYLFYEFDIQIYDSENNRFDELHRKMTTFTHSQTIKKTQEF
jgi:hypothetical protein